MFIGEGFGDGAYGFPGLVGFALDKFELAAGFVPAHPFHLPAENTRETPGLWKGWGTRRLG